ncbi:MAG TPA: hemolysin III family protein [Planctomycetaceae bacterium]
MATPAEGARDLYRLPGFYDPFSAISHLFGAALFLVLGLLLLRRGRGDGLRLALLSVYAVSCVFLFSMSGVYHMTVGGGTARAVMARLDHGAIFVLIAATFTPVHGLLFRGRLRWGPLAVVWSAAAAAIALKTVFFDSLAEWIGLTLYLTLGWLGAASGILIARRRGFGFVAPLFWGGVAYSVGAATDSLDRPALVPGVVRAHEVFHLAVLVGALLHYAFIWRVVAEHTATPTKGGSVSGPDQNVVFTRPKGAVMRIEFLSEPEDDRHEEAVLWEAVVDGRRVRCRFTRDAVRSVMPLAADKRDLRARVASHRDVFAGFVAKKLGEIAGEPPAELTVTQADVPAGSRGAS